MGRHVKSNRVLKSLNTGFYWIKIYNLLPDDDPLRQEVRDRSNYESDNDTMEGEFLTGRSKHTFDDGSTRTVDNRDLFGGTAEGMNLTDGELDTQDPGLKEYLKDGQDLLDKINKKYAGQPGHETLMSFTSLIGNYYDSVRQGTGIMHAPGVVLYGGAGKLTDVTYGLNSEYGSRKDSVFDWKYRSSEEYEAASHYFSIDKIYKDMAEGIQISTDWEKAWDGGEPDLDKLREIEARFNKNAQDYQENVDKFAEKYREDMKLPPERQKARKLFKDEDIESGEIIDGPRAINGATMHSHQTMMKHMLANGILAAEMIQAKKQIPDDPAHQELREAMDDLTTYALTCQNSNKKLWREENEMAAGCDRRAEKMIRVQELARKLGDPASKKIVETIDEEFRKPANLEALSKYENRKALEEQAQAAKTPAERELAERKMQQEAVKKFTETTQSMANGLGEAISFFDRDNGRRTTLGENMSGSYKALAASMKKLKEIQENPLRHDPDSIVKAFEDAYKASEDYAREHDSMFKGKLGDGRTRKDFANSTRDYLKDQLEVLKAQKEALPNDKSLKVANIEANNANGAENLGDIKRALDEKTVQLEGQAAQDKENKPDYEADVSIKVSQTAMDMEGIVKGADKCPEGVSKKDFLEQQKGVFSEFASKIIAVKLHENYLRDAVENGGYEDKMKEEMLDDKALDESAAEIRQSGDFKRMMSKVESFADLDKLKNLASNDNAGGLMNELYKHGRAVVEEDTRLQRRNRLDKQAEAAPKAPEAGAPKL